MTHRVYRVVSFEITAPYTLHVHFDDGTEQVINFQPILAGEIYATPPGTVALQPSADRSEVHTLVWPNGADFDPETLHDWPRYADAFAERARDWETRAA